MEFTALDGGRYKVSGKGLGTATPPVFSGNFISGSLGSIAVNSGPVAHVEATVRTVLTTSPDEEFTLHGGTVHVGTSAIYDRETFAFRGDRHTMMWLGKTYGFYASTGKPRRWLADYFTQFVPEEVADGVRLTPRRSRDWAFDGEPAPVTVTVPEVGVLNLEAITTATERTRPKGSGARVPAGELYRNTRDVSDPAVRMYGKSAFMSVQLFQGSPDAVTGWVSGLDELTWTRR